jgi:hypothetical protein
MKRVPARNHWIFNSLPYQNILLQSQFKVSWNKYLRARRLIAKPHFPKESSRVRTNKVMLPHSIPIKRSNAYDFFGAAQCKEESLEIN